MKFRKIECVKIGELIKAFSWLGIDSRSDSPCLIKKTLLKDIQK